MIVSLSEFKTEINFTSGDTTNDTLFTEYIKRAQNIVEQYLNYTVESSSKTDYFYGDSSASYYLSFIPTTTISTLKYKTDLLGSYTTVSSAKYSIYQANGLYYLYYEDGFNESYYYELVYTQGYSTIPTAIKKAVLELAASYYKEKTRGSLGLLSEGKTLNGIASTTVYANVWSYQTLNELRMFRKETV